MQLWRLLCLRNKTNAVGFSSNFIKYSFHVNSQKPVTICFANHNQHVWTAWGLSEKVERRVVVGGSGEGGRRRVSFNFSSFNFATRPKPRLSSPLLNLTSSASLVSSKVSREVSGERQHVKNNIGQCCPGWHKSLSPGTKQILSFQAHVTLTSNAFQHVFLKSCNFSSSANLRHVFEFPLASPSSLTVSRTMGRGWFLSWTTHLVILVGFHLGWFAS